MKKFAQQLSPPLQLWVEKACWLVNMWGMQAGIPTPIYPTYLRAGDASALERICCRLVKKGVWHENSNLGVFHVSVSPSPCEFVRKFAKIFARLCSSPAPAILIDFTTVAINFSPVTTTPAIIYRRCQRQQRWNSYNNISFPTSQREQ